MLATVAVLACLAAPSLSEAHRAPDGMALLQPHHSVTLPHSERYIESQAYRWNGAPMCGQRWNRAGDRTYWRYPGTGTRVMFDGVTFRNFTSHPVIVAGWLDG